MITTTTHKIKGGGTLAVQDRTFTDLARAYDGTPHPDNVPHLGTASGADMRDDSAWYGGLRSLDAAKAIMTDGWSEGAARLETVCSDLAPPSARTRRRVAAWRDQGDDLHVDRALRGEWDAAWRTSRREWTPGPATVDVHTKLGGHCEQDADALFWQGAACAIVCDRLEAAGYAVRLIGCYLLNPDHGENRLLSRIVLKESDEPLRIDSLASVVCHAGIFRTFGFRSMLDAPLPFAATLGTPLTWERMEPELRAAGEYPDGIVIGDSYSRSACLAAIASALATVESR